MRVLVIGPGPKFSVEDVRRGWCTGLARNGCEVGTFDLGAAISFFDDARLPPDDNNDEWRDPFTAVEKVLLGADGIYGECFKALPDLVLIISGFYIPMEMVPIIRSRGIKVAYVFTESPYEDDRWAISATQADACIVNDPTNLAMYPANTYYQPHCYDPDQHYPGTDEPKYDFTFVGTGYPSRRAFFNAVDWRDLNVRFEGNWQGIEDDEPIRRFIGPIPEFCTPNTETANLYRSSKATANFYRREANRDDLVQGWAMGPREVEAAACKTFLLRDPRPESDEVLGMLPTFSTPEEFTERLHWWIAHPDARADAVEQASSAIADRTFENAARRLLETLNLKDT